MKVHIEIDRPRWFPRLSSRPRRLAAALAVVGLVAAPAGVLASDRFSDIPDTSSSHATVDKIADAGIVRGCGDGTQFCPGRNLTRLEMAQFLARGAGSASGVSRNRPGQDIDPSEVAEALAIDVTVAGIPGNQQQVKVDADVVVRAPVTDGCPCEMTLFLQEDETPSTQFGAKHFVLLTQPEAGRGADVPVSLSFVFDGETGTTETFILTGEVTDGIETLSVYGDMTATVYPFSN